MPQTPYLFSTRPVRDYLDHALASLAKEIDALPPSKITGTDIEALTQYFIEKYTISVPTIDEAGIEIDQREMRIDVSHDPRRVAFHVNPGKPAYVTGASYTYHVPFRDGDPALFSVRSSTFSSNFPAATVGENELRFTYEDAGHDASRISNEFANDLASTKQFLARLDTDVQQYNQQLPTAGRNRLTERRAKLTKDQAVVQSLGYPLRRRPNAPNTYSVPIIKKKIPLPTPARGPLEPLPITDETYEDILSIIQNMVGVMERSPAAFQTMKEEDLRNHFLVQLNGQYGGEATGETFNNHGKTDILIRHENKNLFIAECKFWDGPASLTQAIEQLLGYAQWRDTKTAILLFSRNKDFTNVLQQIPTVVKAHPEFVRQHEYQHETAYRFAMRQKTDEQRFLTMTVMAFNIPI
jgi:hypothetical protein